MGRLQTPLLQRKCACGNLSLGQQCDQCRKKPGQAHAARAVMDAASGPHSFGHDFSRIQVHNEVEQGSSQSSASHRGTPQLESASAQVKKKQFFCPPAGESITAISKATGGGGTIGLTKIDKASQLICSPNFKVNAKAGFCTFDPVAVSLSMTSKFASPTPGAITSDTIPVAACGNKDVPVFFKITAADSALAQKGEQEHCDDETLAFNQTLLPCSTELNKFAGQKIPGKSDAECFKSLKARLGFDPDACTLEFVALSDKTGDRDIAPQSFHDFDPVLISQDCTKILAGLKPSATNKIGDPSVAPAKWIPASSKCPKTKAAAPAPSPTPSTTPSPSPAPSPGGSKPAPKSPKKEE
ncbi:MAG TPA: hypothetical protein VF532_18290 [Candidatus Angelobacter sp.]